jgi:hypothetical protein
MDARENILNPPTDLILGEKPVSGGIHFIAGKTKFDTVEIIGTKEGGYFTNVENVLTPERAIIKTPLKLSPESAKPTPGGRVINTQKSIDAYLKSEELGKPLGTSQTIKDLSGTKTIDVFAGAEGEKYIIKSTSAIKAPVSAKVSASDQSLISASGVEPLGSGDTYFFRLTHDLTNLESAIRNFKAPGTATSSADTIGAATKKGYVNPYAPSKIGAKNPLVLGKEYVGGELGSQPLELTPKVEGAIRTGKGGTAQVQIAKGTTTEATTPFPAETITELQGRLFNALKPPAPRTYAPPIMAPATKTEIPAITYDKLFTVPGATTTERGITRERGMELERGIHLERGVYVTKEIPVTVDVNITKPAFLSRERGMELERNVELERGMELERNVELERAATLERVVSLERYATLERMVSLSKIIGERPPPPPPPTSKPPGAAFNLPRFKLPRFKRGYAPPTARSMYADLLSATVSELKYGKVTHPSLVRRPELWVGEVTGRVPTVEQIKGVAKKTNTFIKNLTYRRKRR